MLSLHCPKYSRDVPYGFYAKRRQMQSRFQSSGIDSITISLKQVMAVASSSIAQYGRSLVGMLRNYVGSNKIRQDSAQHHQEEHLVHKHRCTIGSIPTIASGCLRMGEVKVGPLFT
eukprot:2174365-Pleurochrysis_carterae.AAC.2